MSFEEEYREKLRKKKNDAMVTIMKCHLDILYNSHKVKRTDYTKFLDKRMFQTVQRELNNIIKEFE